MAQRAASYGEAVLHAPTGALHKNAFSDEAASFHFAMKHYFVSLNNMKHSLRSYDVKYENESFSASSTVYGKRLQTVTDFYGQFTDKLSVRGDRNCPFLSVDKECVFSIPSFSFYIFLRISVTNRRRTKIRVKYNKHFLEFTVFGRYSTDVY